MPYRILRTLRFVAPLFTIVVAFLSAMTLNAADSGPTAAEVEAEVGRMFPGYPDKFSIPEDLLEIFRDLARQILEWQQEPQTTSSMTMSSEGFGGEFAMMSSSLPEFPNPDCLALDHLLLPTYEDWRTHFTIAAGQEAATPMNDGVANYVKFALGLDPTGARICLPHPVLAEHPDTEEIHLALQFTRPQWIENVGYTVESSEDLMAWSQDALPPTVAEPVPDTNYETVLLFDRQPAETSSRRFLRLAPEPSNGIRISAHCEADEGILVEIDVSAWLTQNPGASIGEFTIERATSPQGPFTEVGGVPGSSLDSDHRLEFLDKTAQQNLIAHYRTKFLYITNGIIDETPYSNVAYVHATCPQPGGPNLVAWCRPDRIVLKWLAPEWAHPKNGVAIRQWTLMRSTDPEGPYSQIAMGSEYDNSWGQLGGLYLDTAVLPGIDYHYYVSFQFTDDNPFNPVLTSPNSDVASASTCDDTPEIGPMDVAFVWDNTLSDVRQALDRLKNDPALIDLFLDDIQAASGGDYRLALVSTDTNIVNVRVNFTLENRAVFKSALQNLPSLPGENWEESTDECLNTAVNGLWACHRDLAQNEEQIGNFSPPFGRYPPVGEEEIGAERQALKVVVLLTDDLPGGFGDLSTPEIRDNAERYAQMARCKDIRISAIMVGWHAEAPTIMLDYAGITGGWYSQLVSQGLGVEEAILSFVYEDLPSYSTPMPDCEQFPPTLPCSP